MARMYYRTRFGYATGATYAGGLLVMVGFVWAGLRTLVIGDPWIIGTLVLLAVAYAIRLCVHYTRHQDTDVSPGSPKDRCIICNGIRKANLRELQAAERAEAAAARQADLRARWERHRAA
jgi:hypothetical protein